MAVARAGHLVATPLWIVYVRRSMKSAEDANVSDETQEAVCRSRIPSGAHVEVIRDSGGHNSGAREDLPGYQRLLSLVRQGGVAGVAVYDGSRLSRNLEKAAAFLRECETAGTLLVAGSAPPESLFEPEGRFGYNVQAAASQFERDRHAQRMNDACLQVFKGGGHLGHAPLGYHTVRDRFGKVVHPRSLEILSDEADIVRCIWRELRMNSLDGVADVLNRDAVPRREGGPWTRDAVKDVWRRGRFYLGYVVWKRGLDERIGRHEPILDEETYRAAVQAVRARTRAGSKPKPHRTYLLRGVVVCACGTPMRGEARVQRGGEQRYYRCPAAGRTVTRLDANRNPVRCDAKLVPADAAEQAVLRAIESAVLPQKVIDAARTELRQRLSVPVSGIVDRKRRRLEGRLIKLRDLYEWGDLAESEYRTRVAETREALELLPSEDRVILFDRNRRVLTSMAENIAAASPIQRSELVRLLVERVVARDRQVRDSDIEWTPPAQPFFETRCLVCPQGDSNP